MKPEVNECVAKQQWLIANLVDTDTHFRNTKTKMVAAMATSEMDTPM